MRLEFANPHSKSLLKSRNILLQKSLRPSDLPYSIDEEYPLVLASDRFQHSLCALEDDLVVGHINIWPRLLISDLGSTQIPVALVGNVATDPDFRGQGIMKQLLERSIAEAKAKGYVALFLWSDLHEFYQKFGFSSFGTEFRLTFTADNLRWLMGSEVKIHVENQQTLSEGNLDQLLRLRCPTEYFIRRSINEFKASISIPDSFVITTKDAKGVTAYAIIGRGFDLAGVIHEWGCKSPEYLLALIGGILIKTRLDQITLLAPTATKSDWLKTLRGYSSSIESHPMALARIFSENQDILKALESCYIWGLDSI